MTKRIPFQKHHSIVEIHNKNMTMISGTPLKTAIMTEFKQNICMELCEINTHLTKMVTAVNIFQVENFNRTMD